MQYASLEIDFLICFVYSCTCTQRFTCLHTTPFNYLFSAALTNIYHINIDYVCSLLWLTLRESYPTLQLVKLYGALVFPASRFISFVSSTYSCSALNRKQKYLCRIAGEESRISSSEEPDIFFSRFMCRPETDSNGWTMLLCWIRKGASVCWHVSLWQDFVSTMFCFPQVSHKKTKL